jgi:hypothetical protein
MARRDLPRARYWPYPGSHVTRSSAQVVILSIVISTATITARQTVPVAQPVWEIGMSDGSVFEATSISFYTGVRNYLYMRQDGRWPNIHVALPGNVIVLEVPLIEIASISRDAKQTPFVITLTGGGTLTGTIRGTFEGKTQVQGFPATVVEPIDDIRSFRLQPLADRRISADVTHLTGGDKRYDEFWWMRPELPVGCGEQTGPAVRLTVASPQAATLEVPSDRIASAKIAAGKAVSDPAVELVLRDGRTLSGTVKPGLIATGRYRGMSGILVTCSLNPLSHIRSK